MCERMQDDQPCSVAHPVRPDQGLVTCRMAPRGISEVDPNGKTRVLTRMGLHIPSCRRVCVSDMEDTANK